MFPIVAGDQTLLGRIEDLLPEILVRLRGPEGISHLLGAGRDGTVYEMIGPTDEQNDLFRGLAVKVWHDEFRSRSQEVQYQREALEAVGNRLFRIPRVVYESQALGAFVMEYVPGQTLDRVLRRSRRVISSSFADEYFDALRTLHAGGVIHGDPHTGNVMVSKPMFAEGGPGGREVLVDGTPWIIDFSRARGAGANTDLEFLQEHREGIVVEDPRP